jgi:hypothetical protein
VQLPAQCATIGEGQGFGAEGQVDALSGGRIRPPARRSRAIVPRDLRWQEMPPIARCSCARAASAYRGEACLDLGLLL